MQTVQHKRLNLDRKLFLLIFAITFTIFIFTNHGHRFSFDEDLGLQQAKTIVTEKPDPHYVQGVSRTNFQFSFINSDYQSLCKGPILCYGVFIGHPLAEVPFIFINYNFHIITHENSLLTNQDFDNPSYVYWRNSLDPDFTFAQLLYGPTYCALAVSIFFLICRTFNFETKNSLILALLFGLTSSIWAYSETSFNFVAENFFILLGFYFFRKFQNNQHKINLIFSGSSLGFAFLVRPDAILDMGVLFALFLLVIKNQNMKLKKFFSFLVPLVSSLFIYKIIDDFRYVITSVGGGSVSWLPDHITPLYEGILGLLFSPGLGIMIFSPILFASFLGFFDFYNRNKLECILFLAIISSFLVYYGTDEMWHGMTDWSARYVITIVPFLLIPLGATLEKRKNKKLMVTFFILGTMGFFFNLVYVIQDQVWYVWGTWGEEDTLYGLTYHKVFAVNPLSLWTFQYSQLTHTIILAFNNLQPDIFLLKVFTPIFYGIILAEILCLFFYLASRLLTKKSIKSQING
jgi:hypothetical protein